jgi:2,3-bisphosphoglycerate-independent phosphoglycerate mutase
VKYCVIIPDGAADVPIPELNGLTALEAASTPNLDRLARSGRVGTVRTTPAGMEAGSDVCSMCLLGYDPVRYHTGRAPLEAAALGIDLGPQDWVFRLNLVTTGLAGSAQEGLMLDHSAGHITDAEARTLVSDIGAFWRRCEPELSRDLTLTPGVSYRNILVDRSGRDYALVRTTPPHSIPGEPWTPHLPRGGAGKEAEVLRTLMRLSAQVLADHPVNRARVEAGLRPATMAWIWGQGLRPVMPTFRERFGLRGAMITAVDLLAGIAAYIGWDRLNVPGITGYHDNDYAGQGRATIEALGRYDIVCCHVEAPDEASHQGDWQTKVASIEAIDRQIVGPVAHWLEGLGDPERDASAEGWRVLVLPDHYTLVGTRKHDPTPPPFLLAGSWVRSVVPRRFTEAEASASDLHIEDGHELMEYFLRSGLASVKRGRR